MLQAPHLCIPHYSALALSTALATWRWILPAMPTPLGPLLVPQTFPLTNPIQSYLLTPLDEPAVVVKLDTAGAIAWTTFLGDAPASETQRIAVDASANAYVPEWLRPHYSQCAGTKSGVESGWQRYAILLKIAPSLGAAVMTVDPKAVSFADQIVGTSSASSDISVGNYGDANLAPTISITGDFSQTNTCSAPVPGGQKCDINVVFKPTASGNRTGTLTVSASGQTTQVMQLTGNGTAPAETFTPTSLVFEPQLTGTISLPLSVQINNNGTGPLTITSLQITGDFAQSNTCGAPIAPGTSCTVQVTFTPTALDNRTGVLTVVDNAPGSPHTLAVSGQGTSQQASVNPTSLTFVSQPVGATSTGTAVTLHNSGTSALAISSISATGDFAETSNCGASLAAGLDCQITVTFTPTAAGNRSGHSLHRRQFHGQPAKRRVVRHGHRLFHCDSCWRFDDRYCDGRSVRYILPADESDRFQRHD